MLFLIQAGCGEFKPHCVSGQKHGRKGHAAVHSYAKILFSVIYHVNEDMNTGQVNWKLILNLSVD